MRAGSRSSLPSLPVLRFHLRVGARLAMLVLLPGLVAALSGVMILGPDYLDSLAGVLFGPGSQGGSGLVIALALHGAATLAAPRISRGLGGWIRHLPVAALSHRRAAGLGVALAELPLLVGLLGLAFAAGRGRLGGLPEDAAGLAVAALATGLAALPVERGWLARPLALVAAVLAVSGGWLLVAGGLGLFLAADQIAGALAPPRPIGRIGRIGSPAPARAGLLPAWIALRALGLRLPGAALYGLLPIAAAGFFLANNREIPIAPRYLAMAARLGALAGLVLFFSSLAESLAVRRPVWPWLRSLPLAARQRVAADARFFAAAALPLVALATLAQPAAAAVALAFLPALAVLAAGAVRRAPERRAGASGEILATGMLAAGAVALLPWLVLPWLLATPWLLRSAAARERELKVSRWLPIHHLAAGDPQSWSPS